MKSTVGCITVLSVVVLATAYPSAVSKNLEEGDKFEGDMVLTPDQQRNGLIDEAYRWPQRKVYYKFFANHHNAAERAVILSAMAKIQLASCITFHPAIASTKYYVNITGINDGCYASVGYSPMVRVYNLQKTGCIHEGKAIHEFLHILGFRHQHAASDRDQYVQIKLGNVQEGRESAFNKFPATVVTDFGVAYDYGSIMHYGPLAFSKNGNPTIVPLDPNASIGQRAGLSGKDIKKLKLMYKCP